MNVTRQRRKISGPDTESCLIFSGNGLSDFLGSGRGGRSGRGCKSGRLLYCSETHARTPNRNFSLRRQNYLQGSNNSWLILDLVLNSNSLRPSRRGDRIDVKKITHKRGPKAEMKRRSNVETVDGNTERKSTLYSAKREGKIDNPGRSSFGLIHIDHSPICPSG